MGLGGNTLLPGKDKSRLKTKRHNRLTAPRGDLPGFGIFGFSYNKLTLKREVLIGIIG